MISLLLGLSAWAVEGEVPAEEIIVYADDFARWDHTRWLVETELLLPFGTILGSDTNRAFRSHALQVRAVVACEKDAKLTKRAWEIVCTIEDIAVRATTDDRWQPPSQPAVEQILREVDAKLTGAVVQIQVDRDGGVTNFDLEGVESGNSRERLLAEELRRIAGRLMAGFHVRIPDHAQRSGQWLEKRSALMDVPGLLGSRGSSTLVHTISAQGPLRIVQTLGEGSTAVGLANPIVDVFGKLPAGVVSLPEGSAVPPAGNVGMPTRPKPPPDFPPPEDGPPKVDLRGTPNALEIEAIFEMEASAVAVFHQPTGVMTERVWAVIGTPTASSLGGSNPTAPYVYRGRLRQLSETERPDLGPSEQLSWPGYQMPGLSPWTPL